MKVRLQTKLSAETFLSVWDRFTDRWPRVTPAVALVLGTTFLSLFL